MLLGLVGGLAQTAYCQKQVTIVQIVKQAPTVITLATQASAFNYGSAAEVTAHVGGIGGLAPTGIVTYSATSQSGTTVTADEPVTGNGIATWAAQLESGTYSVGAVYHGDSNYLESTSLQNPVIIFSATQDFSFTMSALDMTVKQGETWKGNVNLKSINGFVGSVTLSCGALPAQVTCGIPSQVVALAPSTTDANAAITIATVGTSVATLSALTLLFGLAGPRRTRIRWPVFVCIGLVAMTVGCGVNQRYAQTNGTPRGTYKIVINAVSGAIVHSKTVTLTVQ